MLECLGEVFVLLTIPLFSIFWDDFFSNEISSLAEWIEDFSSYFFGESISLVLLDFSSSFELDEPDDSSSSSSSDKSSFLTERAIFEIFSTASCLNNSKSSFSADLSFIPICLYDILPISIVNSFSFSLFIFKKKESLFSQLIPKGFSGLFIIEFLCSKVLLFPAKLIRDISDFSISLISCLFTEDKSYLELYWLFLFTILVSSNFLEEYGSSLNI